MVERQRETKRREIEGEVEKELILFYHLDLPVRVRAAQIPRDHRDLGDPVRLAHLHLQPAFFLRAGHGRRVPEVPGVGRDHAVDGEGGGDVGAVVGAGGGGQAGQGDGEGEVNLKELKRYVLKRRDFFYCAVAGEAYYLFPFSERLSDGLAG